MRALLSVYDKTGVVELAAGLAELGWDLVSSGGTAEALADAGLAVTDIADLTGFPAILGHRVVTLHPKVHGGILADRSNPEHRADMEQYGIEPIDLVVVNLYPFGSDPDRSSTVGTVGDVIDIGGPAMMRAAAKNHAHVGVRRRPADYAPVLDELRAERRARRDDPRRLARNAFAHTAAYDAAIVAWFDDGRATTTPLPADAATSRSSRPRSLRYGENPHQRGARYRRMRRAQLVGRRRAALRASRSATSTCTTPTRRGAASTTSAPDPAVRRSSSTPTRAASPSRRRSPTPTSGPSSATRGRRSAASSRSTGRSTTPPSSAMVAAAQADVVIAPGYDDGVVDR